MTVSLFNVKDIKVEVSDLLSEFEIHFRFAIREATVGWQQGIKLMKIQEAHLRLINFRFWRGICFKYDIKDVVAN